MRTCASFVVTKEIGICAYCSQILGLAVTLARWVGEPPRKRHLSVEPAGHALAAISAMWGAGITADGSMSWKASRGVLAPLAFRTAFTRIWCSVACAEFFSSGMILS